MPKIEIRLDNFEQSLPMRVGAFNMAEMFSKALADTFPEGFAIYDMVDYRDTQAFLIGLRMDLAQEFNLDPNKSLQSIKKEIDSAILRANNTVGDMLRIDGSLGNIPFPITEEISHGDAIALTGRIRNIENLLGERRFPVTSARIVAVVGSGQSLNLPNVFYDLENFQFYNNAALNNVPSFDSLELADGSMIKLEVSLSNREALDIEIPIFPGIVIPGNPDMVDKLDISIRNIFLEKWDSNLDDYVPLGQHPSPSVIRLNAANNFSGEFVIELAGENIEFRPENPPRVTIGGISDNVPLGNFADITPVSALLNITPSIHVIPRKIYDMDITDEIERAQTQLNNTVDEMVKVFSMDSIFPDGFINAEIGEGSYFILSTTLDTGLVSVSGIDIEYNIYLQQDPVEDMIDINGNRFLGLSGNDETWNIRGTCGESHYEDLQRKAINNNNLIVLQDDTKPEKYSTIRIITRSGIDLDFGERFEDIAVSELLINYNVHVTLHIEKLNKVRWKLDTVDDRGNTVPLIPIPLIPALSFDNVGADEHGNGGTNIAAFIESIAFSEMDLRVKLELPGFLDGAIAVGAQIDGEYQETILRNGENTLISLSGKTLALNDDAGNPKKLDIQPELYPVFNRTETRKDIRYIEFDMSDFTGGDIYLACEILTDRFFHPDCWERVNINLNDSAFREAGILKNNETLDDLLTREYPEKEKDWINIHKMLDPYMSGITFREENIHSRLFINGSYEFLQAIDRDFGLTLQLGAIGEVLQDHNWTEQILFSPDPIPISMANITGALPTLPLSEEEFIYRGLSMPSTRAGHELDIPLNRGIAAIFSAMPRNLRFTYSMKGLPEIFSLTPDMFKGEDGGLEVLLVIQIPLELITESGSYISMAEMFEGDKDLFFRESNDGIHPSGDSVFTNVNINSLGLRIDFESSIFEGTYLHIDKERRLFPPCINEPEGGLMLARDNSIDITFDNDTWDIIRKYIIIPEIKVIFPQKSLIQVPRNSLPTMITVAASGSYTIDFNTIGK